MDIYLGSLTVEFFTIQQKIVEFLFLLLFRSHFFLLNLVFYLKCLLILGCTFTFQKENKSVHRKLHV